MLTVLKKAKSTYTVVSNQFDNGSDPENPDPVDTEIIELDGTLCY